ncbi:MAG: nucleotidyltransferase family protein [Oscillospiraceae bacterium]|nr:nucleotidyltransferase family protein [Oscillospiraceae bacterium]
MKIAGIIAEYDPFHNGHAYQIKKTREAGAEAVVVVLGGEFTQRGEPAWCSKYTRAKAALLCGADLVLEMPVPYAVGSAEKFAEGGISVLDALGCVDVLSFGSESGDSEKIMDFAKLFEREDFIEEYKKSLSEGVSSAAAREIAAKKLAPELSSVAANPNDTLGAEYCKWLLRLGSKIKPETVKRYGAGHGEAAVLKSGMASATYLRTFDEPEDIFPFVPYKCYELLAQDYREGKLPFSEKKIEPAVLAVLRNMEEDDFKKIPDCAAEGLYHRVFDSVREATSLDELYLLIKTKRYAMSRVKRIVAGAFLGLDSSVLKNAKLPYIRVLGMNETGAAVLKEAKAAGCRLPVSASLADLEKTSETAALFAKLETKAENLWQLGLPKPGKCGIAYTTKIIKL